MGTRIGLILGGAISLHQDLDNAKKLCEDPVIIAVNNSGCDYDGEVDHWVSMHPFLLEKLLKERIKNGRSPVKSIWAPRHIATPDNLLFRKASNWGGSSSLLAVVVAFDLEIEKIILCGVPMTPEGAHYFSPNVIWPDASQYKAAWKRNLHLMKDRVKSFSGWTAELLGSPTREWIDA